MRPSRYDTTQPHHIVEWSDDIGKLGEHCKCGYMPPNHRDTGNYVRGVNVLHNHIDNSFDGRCHHKYRGMECMRFYGHRGIHHEHPLDHITGAVERIHNGEAKPHQRRPRKTLPKTAGT